MMKIEKVVRPPRADYLECLHLRLQSLPIAPRAATASDTNHGNATIGILASFVRYGEIIEKHRDKKRRLVAVFLSLPVFVEKLMEL